MFLIQVIEFWHFSDADFLAGAKIWAPSEWTRLRNPLTSLILVVEKQLIRKLSPVHRQPISTPYFWPRRKKSG
jgi:hypothetical protein